MIPVTIVRRLELDGGIVLDEVVLASWSGRFSAGLARARPFGTGKAERCVAIGTAAVFAMGFHVPEGAGAVAITLVSARGDAVALGAVADPVFSSGFGVGDDLGVLLAVGLGVLLCFLLDWHTIGNGTFALALHAQLLIPCPAGITCPVNTDRARGQGHGSKPWAQTESRRFTKRSSSRRFADWVRRPLSMANEPKVFCLFRRL